MLSFVFDVTISSGTFAGYDPGLVNWDGTKTITILFRGSGSNVYTATPLPAALPLFAGGLGLLGIFSTRRRKRKASAAVAAA